MLCIDELQIENKKITAKDLLSKVYLKKDLELSIEIQSILVERMLLGMNTDKSLFLKDHNGDLELIKADSFYSFINFINGEFKLIGLEYLKHLNNYDYDTILKKIHSDIDKMEIECVIVFPKNDHARNSFLHGLRKKGIH